MEPELGSNEEQEHVHIEVEKVKKQVSRMLNWKSPWPDGVQRFWIKHLTLIHSRIGPELEKCLQD